ncbi:MAG: flippase-like domain-containing protein, partial [Anaerolineae bacterium]|nr:flippase-like domain-containing protein [Anaerolineae bacterium]
MPVIIGRQRKAVKTNSDADADASRDLTGGVRGWLVGNLRRDGVSIEMGQRGPGTTPDSLFVLSGARAIMMRRFEWVRYLMKSRFTLVIGIVISLVVLGIVLAGVDLDRAREAFVQARYAYVLPAAAILALGMITRAIRWQGLLSGRLLLRHAFSILNVSYLFNSALPFRLGEVVRIFLANRVQPENRLLAPVPVFTALSTIVVERLLDMLMVLGILGAALALLDVPGYVVSGGVVLGLAAGLGMIVLVLLARWPA